MKKNQTKKWLTKRNGIILIFVISLFFFLCFTVKYDTKMRMQEPMVGMTPLKEGTKIATREAEQESIFSMLTLELGSQYNPIYVETQGERMVSELQFQPLAYRDGGGEMYPVLADEIVYGEDGLSMEITLKDEVYFSDGTLLDSKDVEESILLFALVGNPYTETIVGMDTFLNSPQNRPEGIKIIDEKTLVISFSSYELQNELVLELPIQKVPPILWNDSELIDDLGVLLKDGIGTNRYVLSWKSTEGVQLVLNPHYVARTEGETTKIETVNIYDASKLDVAEAVTSETIDYYTFTHDSTLLDEIVNQEILDIYGKDKSNIVTLLANPESTTAMNEALRGTIFYTVDRDALFQGELLYKMVSEASILPTSITKEMTQKPTAENAIDLQQAASFLHIAQTELKDEVNTTTEIVTSSVETLQDDGETVEITTESTEILHETPIVENGNIIVRIPIVKGNMYHKEIGESLKEQLAPHNIEIQLEEYTEYEYADVIYFTKAYDFQFVELPRLETILDIDRFFYQYAIGETKEMADALVTLRSEGINTPVTVYDTLHKLATQQTRIIPLGVVQELTAVSTYWNESILTETTNIPLYVYD
ncbi:MAG: ABC transporter substrate-binding protein [Bacillota bacterium]